MLADHQRHPAGRLDAASSSIRLSLEPAASDRFTRAQLLQAFAEGRNAGLNLLVGDEEAGVAAALKSRGFGALYAGPAEFGKFMAKADAELGATMKAVGLAK